MTTPRPPFPTRPAPSDLEDELGDVLEKAVRNAGISRDEVARHCGIEPGRLQDALDYRSELAVEELGRLAAALKLNEVGLVALAQGKYPRPRLPVLPFALHPLAMPFGIGIANAYLFTAGGDAAILFDTGASHAELHRAWPQRIERLEAVFITHYEAEHVGGLEVVMRETELGRFYGPRSGRWPMGQGLGEGETVEVGGFAVTALATPGHAAEHNCYRVRLAGENAPRGEVLVSGDLVFAGSLGGGYYCCQRQQKHARRIIGMLGDDVVIAPGHGPLTTVGNERRFNPFLG